MKYFSVHTCSYVERYVVKKHYRHWNKVFPKMVDSIKLRGDIRGLLLYAQSTCIFPLFADETSCMTSAHRNDATGHGALMANVAHEEERARHASCTTRLLEYGLSIYRVSGVFNILPRSSMNRFLSLSRIYSLSRFIYMRSFRK